MDAIEWKKRLPDEARFWSRYLATKGDQWPEDYLRRINPETRLSEHLADLIPDGAKILDVGSGPLTSLGKVHEKQFEITAIDPLADMYNGLLKAHGVEPIVKAERLEGEKLTDKFAPDTFDLVHASNSLDHAYDPASIIFQMITVSKKYVYLEHIENVAVLNGNRGLHQWNFSLSDKPTLNGRDLVFKSCKVTSWRETREHNYIIILIQKL